MFNNDRGPTDVAIKFEHRTSKGCPHGPPSDWQHS
ncbi:Casein kinase 1-like protein hd16 [Orobanche hederae]